MPADKDADWRSQLDCKYSESAEFQEILSHYTEERYIDPLAALPSLTALDGSEPLHKTYPAIRFPPLGRIELPPSLDERVFLVDASEDTATLSRQSMRMDESIAGINFLEAMLKTLFERVKEIRDSIIENGNYLYCLTKPLQADDTVNIQSVVLENFVLMRDDSVHLLDEIQVFSADKMQEIVNVEGEPIAHVKIVNRLRDSLVSRGRALQDAAAASLLTVDHLTEYAYSLIQFPPQSYCAADGFAPNWELVNTFYAAKAQWSPASLQYAAYCSSRARPVCCSFFSYLQSPADYDHRLWVQDGPLSNDQLADLMGFLALQLQRAPVPRDILSHALKDLSLPSCGLVDSHCSVVAKNLHLFPRLTTLRLSHNKITYSGIASLATHIFEHGSAIKILFLDHNRINREGAGLLAQILPKMKQLETLNISHNPIRDQGCSHILKHSLNPWRRAYSTFPKLNSMESLAYTSLRRTTRTVDSDSILAELDSDQDAPGEASEEGSEEEEEEEEMEVRTSRSGLALRYPANCYFDDFFLESVTVQVAHGSAPIRSSIHHQLMWVNESHEEFDLETRSEYSEDDGTTVPNLRLSTSSRACSEEKESMSWSQLVGHRRSNIQPSYPLIVRKILALRLRLAAVNMFLKARQRGHPSLTSLDLSHCSLSPAALPGIRHALVDNHNLTLVDLSGHPQLLTASKHCQLIADMLPLTNLHSLVLNRTGIRDNGMLLLAKGIAAAANLFEVQLSSNAIGPTGANAVANLAKTMFVDALSIYRGAKMRPAALRADGKEVDPDGDDEIDSLAGALENQAKIGNRTTPRAYDDRDETASFVDNDIYEGDESDSGEEYAYHDATEEATEVHSQASAPLKGKRPSLFSSAARFATWKKKSL